MVFIAISVVFTVISLRYASLSVEFQQLYYCKFTAILESFSGITVICTAILLLYLSFQGNSSRYFCNSTDILVFRVIFNVIQLSIPEFFSSGVFSVEFQ